jgi:hypothetical protein
MQLVNRDFISIGAMEGELKLSHKKRGYGLTVTTKELIIQKPHTNYYLLLEDILSIIPAEPYGLKPIRYVQDWTENAGLVSVAPGARHYRLMLRGGVLHNRSGLRQLRSFDIILPIDNYMLQAITAWAGLNPLTEGTSLDGREETGGG